MLWERMRPVCGTSPWRSPLNHVARRHPTARVLGDSPTSAGLQ